MKRMILVMMVISKMGYGYDLDLMKPKQINFEVRQYTNMIDPYLAPIDKDLKYGGIFTTDFNIVEYKKYSLFSHNSLHFTQSQKSGTVKEGGWIYELGLGLFPDKQEHIKLEIGKGHHSRHIFEDTRPEHFPVEDHYFLRFNIYP